MIFLVVLALSLVLQWWFARKDPTYHWAAFTISELGQIDGPFRWSVALFYFLPVAVLLFVGMANWWYVSHMSLLPLLLLLLVPIAYLIAAIFPCDKGAPLMGSARNRIHMLFGLLEYAGACIGLLLLSFNADLALVTPLSLSSLVVASGLVLISIPTLLTYRGMIQRIMEANLFIAFFLIDSHL